MPNFVASGATVAFFSTGATGDRIVFNGTQRPRQGPSYTDLSNDLAPFPRELTPDTIGSPVAESGGSGTGRLAVTQHSDYHYRFWLFPSSLNLNNPVLNSNIGFNIWNTFPVPQTLSAINVLGSSVLMFDLTPGVFNIKDFQVGSGNLQIGAGEPTIDAKISFVFPRGTGVLLLKALVASTFSIIPEVPVEESWEFITDSLITWNGGESRLSLLKEPRLGLDMKITLVDFADRRSLYDLIATAIRAPSLVPMFQYATPLNATTAIGGNRIYFDPVTANVRTGQYVVLQNRLTQQVLLSLVGALFADGCLLDFAVGIEVSAPLWYVMPAVPCYINDQSGLNFGTMAGTFSLKADAFTEFALERPGATRTVTMFDSLPVLEWDQLITTDEKFAYRRQVFDGGVGQRKFSSRDFSIRVTRSLKFSVSRLNDDLDYFRKFFATVRGSQKPFLKSTQLPDLGLNAVPAISGSTLTLDRGDYVSKFFPYDAFKRIEILYKNGQKSYHKVLSGTIDSFGVTQIVISPALAASVEYTLISRISYLQKLTAADTVLLEHYNDYSYVKFNAQTVEA
jgi:hypothetical protein